MEMSNRSLDPLSPQNRSLTCLIALCAVLFAPGCGSSVELTSEWTGREVAVDGVRNDWTDLPARLAGPDVRIGMKNDKDNLYVCLTTQSRSTQFQMLALGTTVWFDAEGKKNKSFGIQFPVMGLLQGRRPVVPGNPEEAHRFMEALVAAAQSQFEIIGPEAGERKKIADRQAKGIDVHLGYEDGTLTYELKVPLQRTADVPYGAALDPSKPFMIGFETGDFAEMMRLQASAPGGARGAAGAGGRGRGGRGGSGGGAALPGGDTPEPLKHWLTIHLAGGSTGTGK